MCQGLPSLEIGGAKLSQIKKSTIVDDVGKNVPIIYETLDNQQA